MTTGPRLRLGNSLLPGILAVALFIMMALIVLNTGFGAMQGFPEGISVTAELGYAMFGFEALQSTEQAVGNTEPFLAALLLIAVVLDAALDASLVLAKRETEGEPVVALSSASSGSTGSTGDNQVAAADGGEIETTERDTDTETGGETR